MAHSPPLLEVSSIRKTFPGVLALSEVTFDLRAGEVHALVGENGAGKSTLLAIMNGLTVPDSGDPQADGDSDGPREDAAPEDSDGEADDAPDPALVSEIIERIDQIRAAADGAELLLTASGDLKTALAGMDEIYEQAAEARRSLKAATSGRKAPAARPGALRDKVLAHLDAHPDGEFTPHEIHKVLNHSSGAIANALDVLVKLREAELATEKPHRYRRSAQPTTPAAETDGTGGAQDDSAELAGAA